MFVNRKGSKKRPGKQGYLFTIYDENREVIATLLSERRDSKSMLKVFKMTVEETRFYPKIISMTFLENTVKIKHIHAHFETKFIPYDSKLLTISQNRIERYHSEIRPKEVKMCGIKTSKMELDFSN